MAFDINSVIRLYKKRLAVDQRLQDIASRHASVPEAQYYADRAGAHMATAIKTSGIITPEMSEAETEAILQALTKQVEKDVSRVSTATQRSLLRKAGTGLSALDVEHDPRQIRELAAEIAGKEITDDFLKTQLSNQAMKFADRITAVNAQAQDAIGLKVRITRTYDDVGLHGGKDDCEWCLERVGDWDNYKDAYDAGAFERHPGCGCLITYEVGKTRTWSVNKSGWSDL